MKINNLGVANAYLDILKLSTATQTNILLLHDVPRRKHALFTKMGQGKLASTSEFLRKPSVSLLKCKRTLVLHAESYASEALAKDVHYSLA
jgi:hypothetical protein